MIRHVGEAGVLLVQDRVEQIVEGRDRLDGLVEAMLVILVQRSRSPS